MLKSKVRLFSSGRPLRPDKANKVTGQLLIMHLITDYTFHAYGRTEGVCGIIISDHEYPALVAHQLLSKVMDEFLAANPRSAWISAPDNSVNMPELKEYLTKYQDPHQADSIMKIQKELDETKIVLHKTIESVLQRGEKIDDLVAKSDGLSNQSKMFYRKPQFPCSMLLCFYVNYPYQIHCAVRYMM
ncbi:hypothetical protein RRF57_011175 [Xylaria bambusicola]|uniref:V-SNARE coiled-coil homology domain-containing protein n=1 Tax=Xylaria bambusicola TaxID=326684 RepID=A0AAN7UXP7_9PEZI